MSSHDFSSYLQDLFETTSDLIHFASIEGDIRFVNPAWLKLLEYDSSEVLGQPIFNFIHPDERDHYKSYRSDTLLHLRSDPTQIAYLTKSGKKVIVEGLLGVAFIDGKPAYTRGVFKDITSCYEAEKKLEENEKRLQTFFQNAPDAIIVINDEQSILEWNPKAELIFGFKSHEVIGSKLAETIIPPQYREAHHRGMAHFLKTGEGPVLNKTIEITALKKSGQQFYIDLSISSVKIENEWLFIAFISDISERKKTEDSLIRKEAELMQSKLMAEKKDQFISIASHELKTPLTTIKAYTQLALSQSSKCPENVGSYLKKVDTYTGKLNTLINDLLDVSKLHAGKLKLTQFTKDFSVFLEEAINSIQQITSDHTIVIHENDHANVTMDVMRMEQVIANLISNAAKYSPGENEIVVRSHRNNDHLLISITDFGIGIAKDKQENIFTRFFRVDESEKYFSGLGIGLFISSEIISQHGGKIWVESNLGKGSTFYFSLPVSQVHSS
jgi:PAS domain S-box-containing protein